ncbi:hypothetical protein CHH28_10930 [Bacterioplanes sanyensis]|uniref:Uncharacterized protein n=1 Tax=Bacterioplanes sanyensis TaxID=1249553 RepID=A0A222FK84_9GAMM|nr:hypothetical protein [Bacterioplanes sanyensis]ASP39159.1 hypothetical protein CHH28_10930 [Bacterioplanes sanyensis]
MKKLFYAVAVFGIAILVMSWSSYRLMSGYRLQGFYGHHGWIFYGYTNPVITKEVMGVQGCAKGYLYGWTAGGDDLGNFLLNTSSKSVEWMQYRELNNTVKRLGCSALDLNKQINLASFRMGYAFLPD